MASPESTPSSISLEHVNEKAEELGRVVTALDSLAKNYLGQELILPHTPAEQDSLVDPRFTAHIEDLLSHVNVLTAAALDHADALSTWGLAAAKGQPTPVWAPWSVARSLLETCGTMTWLTEESVDAQRRVARTLSLARTDLENQKRLGAECMEQIQAVEHVALSLGLGPPVGRSQGVLGFLEPMPTYTKRVELVIQQEYSNFYSLLSSVSHGDPWAIIEMGYAENPDTVNEKFSIMQKKYPAFWLWTTLTLATEALSICSETSCRYRGWM